MERAIQQEAEFSEQIKQAAEMACEKYRQDTVCIFSGRCGTLVFPDLETAIEAAKAAASRFDIFSYQVGLNVNLSAVEDMVRDNCVTYYCTRWQKGKVEYG